jgi:hypothetical protein
MNISVKTATISDVLDTYVITHFSKKKIRGVDWYAIGVVKKDIFDKGEWGVDYLPQVYEDKDVNALYGQILSDVGCI